MDPNYSANNKKVVESEDESKDSDYSPSSSNDGRPSKSSSRTNFTNALLKYVVLYVFMFKIPIYLWVQLFTSNPCQEMYRVSSISWCLNGTFPWRNYSQSLLMEHFLQEHVHYFMEPAKCKIYLCLEGDLPSMNQTIRNKIFKKGQLHIIFLYTELVPNQQKTPHLTNQFVKALDFYLRLLDVVFSTRPVEDRLTITKVVAAQF